MKVFRFSYSLILITFLIQTIALGSGAEKSKSDVPPKENAKSEDCISNLEIHINRQIDLSNASCPYCHESISDTPAGKLSVCSGCHGVTHKDCFVESERCPIAGCKSHKPETAPKRGLTANSFLVRMGLSALAFVTLVPASAKLMLEFENKTAPIAPVAAPVSAPALPQAPSERVADVMRRAQAFADNEQREGFIRGAVSLLDPSWPEIEYVSSNLSKKEAIGFRTDLYLFALDTRSSFDFDRLVKLYLSLPSTPVLETRRRYFIEDELERHRKNERVWLTTSDQLTEFILLNGSIAYTSPFLADLYEKDFWDRDPERLIELRDRFKHLENADHILDVYSQSRSRWLRLEQAMVIFAAAKDSEIRAKMIERFLVTDHMAETWTKVEFEQALGFVKFLKALPNIGKAEKILVDQYIASYIRQTYGLSDEQKLQLLRERYFSEEAQ